MTYPYQDWARANLRVQSDSGVEWLVYCPNPEHQSINPHCSFNVDKGVWYCFSCGHRGSLDQDREEIDEMRVDVLRARLTRMREDEEDKAEFPPETMLKRYNVKNDFWRTRKINSETAEMFELGFDTIANAATIPLRTPGGSLVGVTRRFLEPEKVGTKYKYPKRFSAVRSVFASWLAEDFDMTTVYKTEGSIDALRLWQLGLPAVAFYGNSVSPEQVRTLLEMGVQKFVDFSDNDQGGVVARERSFGYWHKSGNVYTYKPSTDMSQHFRMMTVNDFSDKKDAGEMTDDEIIKAVRSVTRNRIRKYTARPAKRYQKSSLSHVY